MPGACRTARMLEPSVLGSVFGGRLQQFCLRLHTIWELKRLLALKSQHKTAYWEGFHFHRTVCLWSMKALTISMLLFEWWQLGKHLSVTPWVLQRTWPGMSSWAYGHRNRKRDYMTRKIHPRTMDCKHLTRNSKSIKAHIHLHWGFMSDTSTLQIHGPFLWEDAGIKAG